jgi:RNA polymerase sigma factor (sigma-70 family)
MMTINEVQVAIGIEPDGTVYRFDENFEDTTTITQAASVGSYLSYTNKDDLSAIETSDRLIILNRGVEVALNTAISLYRKSSRSIKTEDFSDVSFKIKSVDYDDTKDQQLKALYDEIRELSDIEKALIFLYLEDKPYKEIAITLGITEVNARVKMNRAKDKLKKSLNP